MGTVPAQVRDGRRSALARPSECARTVSADLAHAERLKVPQRLLNALFLLHRDDTAPHWNVQAERLLNIVPGALVGAPKIGHLVVFLGRVGVVRRSEFD